MAEKGRAKWASRSTFILAAVGSAVGLGNAWRFPGLAAKHGGGAFLMVYLVAMVVIGMPLLMMEISIGRKMRMGAPGSLRGINKKAEPIGWAAVTNAFVIAIYYAVVFAWVILMAFMSFKFADITGDVQAAGSLWSGLIQSTGTTSGYATISLPVVICLFIAWVLMYLCIRNGAQTVGKVVKYTVFLPIICLVIMAVNGLFMPGALDGIRALFMPDISAFSDPTLWIDACGQVFYSLSIMMAVMFAYGSFLERKSNIAVDAVIIALLDSAISVLAGVVMFSTMGGTNMLGKMTSSGIGTAFIVYPQAIVNLSDNGILNSIFAFIFYFCLCTLAIDSAFSIVEGVATAIADKFDLSHKKTTIWVCVVAGTLSLFFVTGAGFAWLDIVDNWCNSYSLILVGILEAIAVGWCFKTSKVIEELNKNTKRFKVPAWWFNISIKFIAPIVLITFFIWNVVSLFANGGIYGVEGGYSLAANIIGGWVIMAIVFASGFIVKLIVKIKKKNGYIEKDISWDEAGKE